MIETDNSLAPTMTVFTVFVITIILFAAGTQPAYLLAWAINVTLSFTLVGGLAWCSGRSWAGWSFASCLLSPIIVLCVLLACLVGDVIKKFMFAK